jgi:hypothetical protein
MARLIYEYGAREHICSEWSAVHWKNLRQWLSRENIIDHTNNPARWRETALCDYVFLCFASL